MKKTVFSLFVASLALVACGSSDRQEGSQILTPRFDDGHFRLLECHEEGGPKLTVDMIVRGDHIKGLTIDDKVKGLLNYDFVRSEVLENDEGNVTKVTLAVKKNIQKAEPQKTDNAVTTLSWNLEQSIASIERPSEERLDWTGCSIKNQRVWESLSLTH